MNDEYVKSSLLDIRGSLLEITYGIYFMLIIQVTMIVLYCVINRNNLKDFFSGLI